MSAPREGFNPGVRPNNIGGINNNGIANRGNIGNFDRGNVANLNRNNFNNNNININRNNGFGGQPWHNSNSAFGVNNQSNWNRPYYPYHSGWVNGYWPGHYGGWNYGGLGYGGLGYGGWGYGLGGAPFLGGLAIGGLGAWGLNPYSYGWGYSNYSNPFLGAPLTVVNQPLLPPSALTTTGYDYAMPLDTGVAAPSDEAIQPALSDLDAAREAFRAGDFPTALARVDGAIKAAPNDADAHEFRGVILFALGQYRDAATSLYTVLSAGPGWDWTTLISLYPSIEPYTQQLRAIEQYRLEHPQDPSPRFVLAYLYTCQGANDAAAREYDELHKLLPNDPLITRLERLVAGEAAGKEPAESPPANPTPDPAVSPAPTAPSGNLTGAFKATPAADTRITLNRNEDGTYTWDVSTKGQSRPIKGTSTYQGDVLTLTQSDGPPLAGKVTWDGTDKFNFRLVGNGPEDPGLSFSR